MSAVDKQTRLQRGTNRLLFAGGFASLTALFIISLSYLLRFKSNLPIADEWGNFNPVRGLDHTLSLKWMFVTTNSHPMVIERVIQWYFLRTTGYDFRMAAILQLVFMFVVALSMCLLMKKLSSGLPIVMAGLFTAAQGYNLFWPFEVLFFIQFFLIFWAAYFIAQENPRVIAAGYLISVISIVQSGGGLAAAPVFIVIGLLLGWRHNPSHRRLHFSGAVCVLAGLLAWVAFSNPDNPLVIAAAPWNLRFWTSLAELVSNGLGVTSSLGILFGRILLAALAVALLYLAYATRLLKDSTFLTRFGVILAGTGLAIALSVSLTRATGPGSGLNERYHIIGYHLLVSIFFVALDLLDRFPFQQKILEVCRILLVMTLGLTLTSKLGMARVYKALDERQTLQLTCAQDFFRNPTSTACDGGPYGDEMQIRAVRHARELGATWCFEVMALPQVPKVVDECYAQLFERWSKEP